MFNLEDAEKLYQENKELVDSALEANKSTDELIKSDPRRWARDLVESVFGHAKDD